MQAEPTASPTIGLDFGGTSVKIGVCQGGELLEKANPIPTKKFRDANQLITAMAVEIGELKKKYPEVTTLGVGAPGHVDSKSGMIYMLTNVPGWKDVPIRDRLQQATGLATIIDNDANCMTYAEWKYGAGEGLTNLLGVTLGTGVGGGLILNDRLYRGSQGGAGELGQMSINFRGKRGNYDNLGAVELYVGNSHLAERAMQLYTEAEKKVTPEECTPKALAKAAREEDPIAVQVWEEKSDHLACVLMSVIWLLNLDAIIIGGGMAQAGNILFTPLRKKIRAQLPKSFADSLQIIPAKLGNDAGIIGSAAIASDVLSQSL